LSPAHAKLRELYARRPVILAPLEDVSDAVFRRICRARGAEVCLTEFVNVEGLLRGCRNAKRKIKLEADDQLTAIQIYGADPERLAEAARIAEEAGPAFIDINCGCWIPKIARRGAGAGWLRDPEAMVAMAREIAASVSLPVTVKTRIGWGPESHMPIVDLARRLEDVGVAALTIHCRTAAMGHNGPADWSWAARAQAVVSIPVIVNGDIRTADDAIRALDETRCAAVMIGRGAIDHPWIFRELRARFAGQPVAPPTDTERRALYLSVLDATVLSIGERDGVASTKRYAGFLGPLDARRTVLRATTLDDTRRALGL
jgi:nifR3 family TIM-barrel protein